MDHGHAKLLSHVWAGDLDELPAEPDRPLLGPDGAAEDLHERRLARPVLTDQGVHFAALSRQVDRVQHRDAVVALADLPHLKQWHRAKSPRSGLGRPFGRPVLGASCCEPHRRLALNASAAGAYS